jgi:hypothetical protein
MKQKSPQEKKALSYAKDCRNTYGQNDKASRKIIPLRKAKVNRGYRRKVNEVLHQIDPNGDTGIADTVESAARNVKRVYWKKAPDQALGEVVERKLERRITHAGNGKTARKKVREFVSNLKIETEQETDGRWIAEAISLNGVLTYGTSKKEAISKCRSLAEAVYLEMLGAGEILRIKEGHVSIKRF